MARTFVDWVAVPTCGHSEVAAAARAAAHYCGGLPPGEDNVAVLRLLLNIMGIA